tara:strand:+ start:305 stop:823 length:519 start_codon:yes stop_codon:yes gene_type:complete
MGKNGKNKPADTQRISTDISDATHLPSIGRPPRLSKEIKETICRALSVGMSMEGAASLAGVSVSTLYGWIRRGKAAKAGGFSGFVKEINQALAQFEVRNAAIINRAAQLGDWKPALALLERRRSKDWAKTEKHEIGGTDGKPIQYEIVRESGTDWKVENSHTNGRGNANGQG